MRTEAKSVVSAHSSPFRKWLDGYLTANLDMEVDGIPVSVMTIAVETLKERLPS